MSILTMALLKAREPARAGSLFLDIQLLLQTVGLLFILTIRYILTSPLSFQHDISYVNDSDVSYKEQFSQINIKRKMPAKLCPDDVNNEELFTNLKDVYFN